MSHAPASHRLGVVVLNHGLPDEALRLRDAFATFVPSVAFDSGSTLTSTQRSAFDATFENIFYSGLMNEALAHADRSCLDAVLVVCSDVVVGDAKGLVARAESALFRSDIGVYAPCMDASSHPSMLVGSTGGLRDVAFVEGVCFAVRVALLARLCPVDLSVNRIGWGLDVMLGYLAHDAGLRVVVDDAVHVTHPTPSGYSKRDAKRQRDAWFATLPKKARLFRLLTGMKWAHTRRGAAVIAALFSRARTSARTS